MGGSVGEFEFQSLSRNLSPTDTSGKTCNCCINSFNAPTALVNKTIHWPDSLQLPSLNSCSVPITHWASRAVLTTDTSRRKPPKLHRDHLTASQTAVLGLRGAQTGSFMGPVNALHTGAIVVTCRDRSREAPRGGPPLGT
ncbi:unnamed protein product [Pleuronectes platessa]|uniref:Uncharacterized protein n=1 Tax=Pleuronectes platessa TaxID=8262 RepID=A0A9N7UN58_PLEPL|nr:unnamed protein product [Pleuronectes platessa]